MKLELIPCLKPKLSERVKEMIDKIMNTTDDLELADYLFNCKIQDDIEQIDIPAWIPVIAKIDDILSTMAKSVPSLQNKQNPTTLETSTKRIVCGLLTFLYKLLQTKFEKRYFQSFSVSKVPFVTS